MTIRDPIEEAGKPAGLCDICGKLGDLTIARPIYAEMAICEECMNFLYPPQLPSIRTLSRRPANPQACATSAASSVISLKRRYLL